MQNPTSALLFKFLLSISFLLLFACCASSLTLPSLSKGSTLSTGDTLISPNGLFACGFHSVGSNAYTFSIWFMKSANNTVVWTANRDKPTNGYTSKLIFQKDGKVILYDSKAIIWSIDTLTGSNEADVMRLYNTGNLVITNREKNSTIWQSFDTPTDTLLPTQPISYSIKLISSSTKESLSSGAYVLYYDTDNVLKMDYNGPQISSTYWPDPNHLIYDNGRSPDNSTRYAVLDEAGNFSSSDNFAFTASDVGNYGVKRRFTLDYDGSLRLYSLNETDGTWSISWDAFPNLCKFHGLCGLNSMCIYTNTGPHCSCPTGFEMADITDWNKGCKRTVKVDCNGNRSVTFLELRYSDFWGFDLNLRQNSSYLGCEKLCRETCQCNAFSYSVGYGDCRRKNILLNGRALPGTGTNIYIKVDSSVKFSNPEVSQVYQPTCNATTVDVNRSKFNKTYLYWFVGAAFIVEVMFITFGWLFLYRSGHMPKSVEDGYKLLSSQFKKFTYKDLEKATQKFKVELGKGGSGAVYKGVLDDDRVVAVKKLEDAMLGKEEFWAEVSVIGKINHMNLVRMWGFCSERMHKLLVSEYVENGSLAKVLFENELGWSDRFNIAVGVAKGLAYLHHECLEWVIHCDVKPENILLDQNFEAKIADFGLSKLLQRGGGGSNMSHIRGTRGYIAPEWALNLPITGKVDVYSYGVVLLEIVKGGRVLNWAMDFVEGEEAEICIKKLCLVLKEKLKDEDKSWIKGFVDGRLNNEFNSGQAMVMVKVAVSCLEEERHKRPTMESVVSMLLACDERTT